MPSWPALLFALSRKLAMASLPTHARGNLRAQLELFAGADAPKCDRAPSGRILILAPHMDDESFGCGGTMATAVAMGAKITVVFLTNGNKGYEPERTANFSSAKIAEFEEALTITRKQEAQSACSTLGISDLEFLDFPDSALSVSDVSVRRLQEVILRVKPEDIFLPFFCDPHPDHIITNQLLMACIQDSCKAQIRCWGYEIWNPVSANVIVDITTHIGAKKSAMAFYSSQNNDRDYPRGLLGLNAYRALQIGCRDGYGEAFFRAPLELYRDLYAHFSRMPIHVNVKPHGQAKFLLKEKHS